MNYGSMVYVYDWMMKEHQPIGIDYQPIRDNDYIKDLMTQHYIEFNEDRRGESIFWDHTFPWEEFAYNSMARGLTKFSLTLKGVDFVKKSNKKYKASADKKRREKFFEKEDMKIVWR